MTDTQTPDGGNKTFKFITGTEGTPDYLVVAISHGAALGIKPIMMALATPVGFKGVFVGLRVRAASEAGENKVVSMTMASILQMKPQASWDAAFPDIKFDQMDKSRASTQMGVTIPRQAWQMPQIMSIIDEKNVCTSFVQWIMERVTPNQMQVSAADMEMWIRARLQEHGTSMGATYGVMEEDKELSVDYFKEVLAKLGQDLMQVEKPTGPKLAYSKDEGNPGTKH